MLNSDINWQDYQKAVAFTANKGMPEYSAYTNWCFGIVGEIGELFELFKKADFHKHALDQTKVVKELGDISWYFSQLANEEGLQIAKLTSHVYSFSAFTEYLQEMPFRGDEVHFILFELINRATMLTTLYMRKLFTENFVSMEEIALQMQQLVTTWQIAIQKMQSNRTELKGISAEEVVETNVAKLLARYPGGFDYKGTVHSGQ